MNKEPLVSFIVNCYNGEKYLKSCLDSIINQTYCNWELIFWDNCSTDKSKDIFDSYNDIRFKYFCSRVNVNLGQARAWAVDKCIGKYISFLDVDDVWLPNKTLIQVNQMLEDNYVLSYGGIEIWNSKTNKVSKSIPKYSSGYSFADNLCQFEINMPSSMILREALLTKKLNFDKNIKASEEYCLYMQLIVGEKVCIIKDILARYLLRGDSLTNDSIKFWSKEREYTLNKIIESDSTILNLYSKEFKLAFARAEYYKLRYNININEISKARKNALNIYKINITYLIISILTYISPFFLKKILKIYYGR